MYSDRYSGGCSDRYSGGYSDEYIVMNIVIDICFIFHCMFRYSIINIMFIYCMFRYSIINIMFQHSNINSAISKPIY